jgi:hypothetical protein
MPSEGLVYPRQTDVQVDKKPHPCEPHGGAFIAGMQDRRS